MKKLSKTQENVLVILCEGDIIEDVREGTLSLEDGDKNSYFIRHDTFSILQRNCMVELKNNPAMDMHRYGLTKKAEDYLLKHCYEQIKDFIVHDAF